MKKTVLVTGANGFIATQIIRYLLANKEVTVLALVRANDAETGLSKVKREWWDWPELIAAIGTRIEVVCGDVCSIRLGLNEASYLDFASRVTHIIHAAADWRLVSLEELRKTNVQGTANVLDFAREANKGHSLERFSYISTAFVAGARTGIIAESELTNEFGFFTDYERSKYEGEQLVHAAENEFPVSVFRPSMVVGDSRTGAIKTFNTFYFPLRLYLTGKMRFMPVSRSLRINIVPVDYVAMTIAQLSFEPKAEGMTFHLVAPYESLPKLGELLDLAQKWAKTELSCELPNPIYLPMSASSMKAVLKLQRAFSGDRRVSDALISLSPYFSENRQFDRANLDSLLGYYDFKWEEIMPKLLQYAVYNSFFHRSDRTVHEQVLFRLDSKSHPIVYYDLIEGKTQKKTSQEMRQDILAICGALKTLGINPSDRVALTGLNSSQILGCRHCDWAYWWSQCSTLLYHTSI